MTQSPDFLAKKFARGIDLTHTHFEMDDPARPSRRLPRRPRV
jgi:hypothetical protein